MESGNNIFNQLDARHPEVRFELYPTVKGDTKRVYLTGFMVPYSMRGKGLGTKFMEDLMKVADENGFKITLTPSSSYGGNVIRLRRFYKEFGFVENKGSNRDYSHKEDMYRDPKNLNEGNGSLLTEKLTDVDDDVNTIYEMYFRKGIEEIERTGMISAKTFEKTETDTSVLKNELCIKAHEMNPCTIWINKGNNHYNPNKKLISVSVSVSAMDYIISQFDGDLKKAIRYQDPPQVITMKREFTEERIKGSIHHELVHWIDDTLNNRHIKKMVDKNVELHSAGEALPFDSVTVNAHYMEIQAQVHNIKQLHNKYADIWNTLSFEDMIHMSPSITQTYRSLPHGLKTQWIKKLKMRLFREGLLGKKMFN
jgi:predicted GNAT family acetyltransferase